MVCGIGVGLLWSIVCGSGRRPKYWDHADLPRQHGDQLFAASGVGFWTRHGSRPRSGTVAVRLDALASKRAPHVGWSINMLPLSQECAQTLMAPVSTTASSYEESKEPPGEENQFNSHDTLRTCTASRWCSCPCWWARVPPHLGDVSLRSVGSPIERAFVMKPKAHWRVVETAIIFQTPFLSSYFSAFSFVGPEFDSVSCVTRIFTRLRGRFWCSSAPVQCWLRLL